MEKIKIANIVYGDELVNHMMVEYVNYINIPIEYSKLNGDIPTLYVGWSFMKHTNPNNSVILDANILKKEIIPNKLYWEFSFNENKAYHVKGVDNFVNIVPQLYFQSKYQYDILDPVFFSIKNVDNLMVLLPEKISKAYNFKNEMVYILDNNKILGIDMRMLKFFKFDTMAIVNSIKSRCFTYIEDSDGSLYISYYKVFPSFTMLKRYIVTI